MPVNSNLFSFSDHRRVDARRIVPTKLSEARLAKQLTQTDLAAFVEVTRQAISAFEQGLKNPDGETLTRIANKLEQPLAYFSAEDREVFGQQTTKFFRATGPKTKRRNLASDVLGKWFVQIAKYFDAHVHFPAVNLLPPAAPASATGRYTHDELETIAADCRKQWGLGLGPISNAVSLLENKGITICRYVMKRDTIEAFSYWNGERPFVFLASQKESAARARFDAAHELGHLILHKWVGAEELEAPATLKAIEAEADYFAGAFLLPPASFASEVYTTRLDAFVALKHRWKVSIASMVYRCKHIGIIDDDQFTNLYKQMSARRMRTREPLDDVLPLEEPKLLTRAASLVLSKAKTADEIALDLALNRETVEQFCNLPLGSLATSKELDDFRPTLK